MSVMQIRRDKPVLLKCALCCQRYPKTRVRLQPPNAFIQQAVSCLVGGHGWHAREVADCGLGQEVGELLHGRLGVARRGPQLRRQVPVGCPQRVEGRLSRRNPCESASKIPLRGTAYNCWQCKCACFYTLGVCTPLEATLQCTLPNSTAKLLLD